MKNIQLNSLKLENFKGIQSLEIAPAGKSLSILGENAVGKTTIADAFSWLLWGKDSHGQADFEVKTLDVDGKAIPGLDHAVEADLSGTMLRKVYSEKWTKKRGSPTATLTGHEVNHFVDGVPCSAANYKSKVAIMCGPEAAFKLLTSPYEFARLPWKDRRDIVMQVCGNPSDADVVACDASLVKVLNLGRSLDDHKKVIAARKAEINKELTALPVRIDEARRSMGVLPALAMEDCRHMVDVTSKSLSDARAELSRIQNGGAIAELTFKLREAEGKRNEIKNRIDTEIQARVREATKKRDAAESELRRTRNEITETTRLLGKSLGEKTAFESEAERIERAILLIRSTTADISSLCPACGQGLPAAETERAIGNWNEDKAKRLEARQNELADCRGRIEATEKAALDCTSALETLAVEEEMADIAYRDACHDVNIAPEGIDQTPFLDAVDTVHVWKQKIADQAKPDTSEVEARIAQYEQIIKDASEAVIRHESHAQANARIESLKASERKLAEEYERIEADRILCENFTRTKVRLIEGRIAEKFQMARFRMFEDQINGGLAECCDITYNGVPWSSLNHGAEINVGLDVVRTLSAHYGISAPVIVDNAEAVTKLLDIGVQTIRLVVSEPDKTLRIGE